MAYTGQLSGSVVGSDPELKYFESGTVVAKFTVSARVRKARSGEATKRYVRVSVWGKSAEYVGNYIKRGDSVLVTGRVEIPETYVSRKDGETKVAEAFTAMEVEKFTPFEDSKMAPVQETQAPACPPKPPAPPAPPNQTTLQSAYDEAAEMPF